MFCSFCSDCIAWEYKHLHFSFAIVMTIELLPNEVWLEIFSYIHIGDITRAFLRLNKCSSLWNERILLLWSSHDSSYSYQCSWWSFVFFSLQIEAISFGFLLTDHLKHLHFNGIGTINNDVAQFYLTIFNSNRANNIPSVISCSLPSICSLNWNYFNRTNSFDLYQI